MTDAYTDEIGQRATDGGATVIVNQISRLVLDPERFPKDEFEPMSERGMGMVYVQTSDGSPLRALPFPRGLREDLVRSVYEPYADAVTSEVASIIQTFGHCLIIDLHSFPTTALPYEDLSALRPNICIGSDPFHEASALIAQIRKQSLFRKLSFSRNSPFAGSFLPIPYFHRNRQVQSVMLELRRGLYMDEATGDKREGWQGVVSLAEEIFMSASEYLRNYEPDVTMQTR
jgi:N-formylglutamate deformylase